MVNSEAATGKNEERRPTGEGGLGAPRTSLYPSGGFPRHFGRYPFSSLPKRGRKSTVRLVRTACEPELERLEGARAAVAAPPAGLVRPCRSRNPLGAFEVPGAAHL